MNCRNCGRRVRSRTGACVWCGAELGTGGPPDHEHDPRIGSTLDGKYRIDARIGAGAMGTVYCATRLMIGDSVAVKILHAERLKEPDAAERFRREAQAAASLRHGNVVTIHDFGVSGDGTNYLVMELVEGESLRRLIKQEGRFLPPVAAEIIVQVCSALEAAHAQGIVHRDIKPDNILVTQGPAGLHVKVLDFGIARVGYKESSGDLTQAGHVLGTPHYMSPEQCLGEELDGRSDLYSLGVVLYEMLSGVVPFDAPTAMAIAFRQVHEKPTPLHELNRRISPEVEAVVEAAMRKRRDDRPASARALALQMKRAVGDAADAPLTSGEMAPTVQMSVPGGAGGGGRRSPSRARSWMGLAAAVATLLIVVGGGWLSWRPDTEEAEPAGGGAVASSVEPGDSSSAPERGGPADTAVARGTEKPATRGVKNLLRRRRLRPAWLLLPGRRRRPRPLWLVRLRWLVRPLWLVRLR